MMSAVQGMNECGDCPAFAGFARERNETIDSLYHCVGQGKLETDSPLALSVVLYSRNRRGVGSVF